MSTNQALTVEARRQKIMDDVQGIARDIVTFKEAITAFEIAGGNDIAQFLASGLASIGSLEQAYTEFMAELSTSIAGDLGDFNTAVANHSGQRFAEVHGAYAQISTYYDTNLSIVSYYVLALSTDQGIMYTPLSPSPTGPA